MRKNIKMMKIMNKIHLLFLIMKQVKNKCQNNWFVRQMEKLKISPKIGVLNLYLEPLLNKVNTINLF